jgi:hypothetical protein
MNSSDFPIVIFALRSSKFSYVGHLIDNTFSLEEFLRSMGEIPESVEWFDREWTSHLYNEIELIQDTLAGVWRTAHRSSIRSASETYCKPARSFCTIANRYLVIQFAVCYNDEDVFSFHRDIGTSPWGSSLRPSKANRFKPNVVNPVRWDLVPYSWADLAGLSSL